MIVQKERRSKMISDDHGLASKKEKLPREEVSQSNDDVSIAFIKKQANKVQGEVRHLHENNLYADCRQLSVV